jgi:hypothetical protein
MTPNSGKIGLVILVYASPDVDGLHESPCDSAPMYVTRSPVSSCPALLPSPRPWDFPPSIDGDISRADDPMELDDPE